MNQRFRAGATSSPELHHPVPTHPPYDIPEPPGTPVISSSGMNGVGMTEPGGYMRYSSPPPPHLSQQQQQQQQSQSPPRQPYGVPTYGAPPPQGQYQSFSGGRQQAHPQGQMGGGHHQQQVPLQSNSMGSGMPDLQAWGVNDVTAQMGMQVGRSAVAAGQEYLDKHVAAYLPVSKLKNQFNVSNAYVLQKLRLVLFPWRHRPWARQARRSDVTGQNEGWKPPREDINSPDLYIPSMAIVTYILLAALYAGLQKRFNPELLGITSSKAFGVVLVDFCVIWFGCYILAIQGQGQFVDIVAYSGYKFEGVVMLLLGRLLGAAGLIYAVLFWYVWWANGFFMVRSLRYVVLPDLTNSPSNVSVGNSHTPSHSQRSARRNFLFFIAASQGLYMWILSV